MKKQRPLFKLLTGQLWVWVALATHVAFGQVFLETPILLNSNTVRLVVAGPTTNIQYKVYGTNDVGVSVSSWPLLVAGQTNQVIFDLTMPWSNAGFFIVTSNYVAGDQPPPQVATPVFTPPGASGNAAVQVTVTCDTPGAVIYFTTNGATPTTADTYIASGGTLTLQCATTLKARAFRSGFEPSDVATGVYAVNCPPVVFAGTQQIIAGSTTTLAGWVTDDGLSQAVSNWWQQISGPGTVSFGNLNATNTTATFSQDGIYVLQLNAFDGYWTRSNRVTIARNPAISVALTVPAANSVFSVPTNIALEASATTTSGSITQVQFYAGSLLIGTDTTAPWTYEWRNVPAGNHALYAVATSTDPDHFSLLSDAVNITVNFPTDLGRFTLAATDLTIPVAGVPITINRSHDPRYGSGWSLGENMRLDYEAVSIRALGNLGEGYKAYGGYCFRKVGIAEPYIVVQLSETEQYYFQPTFRFTSGNPYCTGNSVAWWDNLSITFTALGERGGTLETVNLPDNIGMYKTPNTCFYIWAGADVAVGSGDEDSGCLETPYQPDWSLFTFVAPEGTRYKFDSSGKLYQRVDRNGNTLTYDWNGITWHHADTPWITKQVAFTRDAFGRITEIYDPIALETSGPPAVKYSYDASGRLTNVARLVDRAGAGTYEHTGYRYDDGANPHLITRVIDPRGITTVSNVFDNFGRLTRQYDALGRYTSFAYENNGRRQVVTDRNGRTLRQEFTEAGQLGSVRDAEGAETRFVYDANGRLTAQVNPLGGTNAFAYNERDEVIGQTDELGHAASATYNEFGLPLHTVDARGFGTTNVYDERGNLLFVTNALGVVHAYGYDAQGNRIAETNALGRPEQTVTLYAYNEFGWLTNLTDARGFPTAYAYDANGNPLTLRRQRTLAGGGTQVLWTTNVYDAMNRVIAVIEPDGLTNRTVFNAIGQVAFTTNKLGVVTRYDYDARGLLTNTVFALGTPQQAAESAAYDPEGRRTNSVDRAGRVTSYTYDGVGRLTRTTFPDGAYVENQYDAGGRLYATVQGPRPDGGINPPPSSLTTRFEYDAAGRRTAVVNALNQTNRYAYDASGNQTAFVDALGRTNLYAYDALNRQTQITYPDGTTERSGYDALDRKIAVTNQTGIVTRFGYDRLGQLVAVTNGFGSGTVQWSTYAYDQVGSQTNQVDALGRVTRFEYDALGRRVREVLPQGQNQGFAYDAAGNLIRQTNFNGAVITNQYDALNRLTNRASGGGYQVRFTYTATGQRASLVDASGTNTYAYDSRDRLLTNATPQGTLVYTYDVFGNLKTIASTTPGGVSLTYAYDALNRLTNVAQASAPAARYTFDAVGNLETLAYANGVTNRYRYDSLNRLTNLVAGTPSTALASFAYRLAPAGQRTNLVETVGGQSRTFTWQYDPLYRLTNEVITGASPAGAIGYRYDAVGNRTNRSSTVGGLTNQTFAYTANDWLTTDVYDANGNTRTNGANVFFYDVENRLTNAIVGGTSVTIIYDGDGNRVRKIVGTTTNTYLVCRHNLTGYAQVLEERVNGALSRVYAYGLDLIAQRDVAGGTTLYFGYDGLGSTRYLTTTNAAVANVLAYDAFGTLIASNAAPQTDYLFAGEQRDPHLGLDYLRARYLNTGTGRFWTRDTHPGNNQDPISLHRYLYAHADPANRIDPSGRLSFTSTISVSGIWGALAGFQLPAISAAKVKIVSVAIAATLTLTGDRAHGDFVYRRLSDRESRTPYMQVGLFATDPTAYWVTPDDHIGRKQKPSPWISTSRDFMVPAKRYLDPNEASNARNPIVKIDLRRIGTTYLDFTNPGILATLQTTEARESAIIDREVLIWGFVSPVAIVASYDGTRLLE